MRVVDRLLEDEQLLDTIYEAQGERYPQSRRRGREQTPAEVVLRLLLLKHIRNWSYDTLEREVRANLVYRAFTRIGDEKVPDAKTLARLGQLIEAEVIEELHQRIVQLAQEIDPRFGGLERVEHLKAGARQPTWNIEPVEDMVGHEIGDTGSQVGRKPHRQRGRAHAGRGRRQRA